MLPLLTHCLKETLCISWRSRCQRCLRWSRAEIYAHEPRKKPYPSFQTFWQVWTSASLHSQHGCWIAFGQAISRQALACTYYHSWKDELAFSIAISSIDGFSVALNVAVLWSWKIRLNFQNRLERKTTACAMFPRKPVTFLIDWVTQSQHNIGTLEPSGS